MMDISTACKLHKPVHLRQKHFEKACTLQLTEDCAGEQHLVPLCNSSLSWTATAAVFFSGLHLGTPGADLSAFYESYGMTHAHVGAKCKSPR